MKFNNKKNFEEKMLRKNIWKKNVEKFFFFIILEKNAKKKCWKKNFEKIIYKKNYL